MSATCPRLAAILLAVVTAITLAACFGGARDPAKTDTALKPVPPASPAGEAAPAPAKPAPKVADPPPAVPPATAKPVPPPDAGARPEAAEPSAEDAHGLQSDDYFTSDRDPEGARTYVHLAKMIEPPSEKTKEEAQFMDLKDGSAFWTRRYWRTRLATRDDLKPAALVVVFEGNHANGVYQAPNSKDDALTGNWFMGRITDVSDLARNLVKVGADNVSLTALRVMMK